MKMKLEWVDAIIDEFILRDEKTFNSYIMDVDFQKLQSVIGSRSGPCSSQDEFPSFESVLDYCNSKGLQVRNQAGKSPFSEEFLKGIVDYFYAGFDRVQSFNDIENVINKYRKLYNSTGELVAYEKGSGHIPLLLLNAYGIPLRVWQHLLSDVSPYKIIIPILNSRNLVSGMMNGYEKSQSVAKKVIEIIEKYEGINIVTWCNADRIGLELLHLVPNKINKLILLSPSLLSVRHGVSDLTAYENNLQKLFSITRANSSIAPSIAEMLSKPQAIIKWSEKNDPITQAAEFFSLPRRDYSSDLSVPMGDAASLLDYVNQYYADLESDPNPVDATEKVVLIQGADDRFVNNERVASALSKITSSFDRFIVSGAGHYCMDLQYYYFRYLLDSILLSKVDCYPLRISRV